MKNHNRKHQAIQDEMENFQQKKKITTVFIINCLNERAIDV